MERIAIFAHYSADNIVSRNVIFYLQELNTVFDTLIFVSTSDLSLAEQGKIARLATRIILRENSGHDFFSYKIAINELDLTKVEQLLLCNDSCLGPLYPLKEWFNEETAKNSDFWGISALSRPKTHLQSYFLVFNRNVLCNIDFIQFWQVLQKLPGKREIIFNYEVGLSQLLIRQGYHWYSLVFTGTAYRL